MLDFCEECGVQINLSKLGRRRRFCSDCIKKRRAERSKRYFRRVIKASPKRYAKLKKRQRIWYQQMRKSPTRHKKYLERCRENYKKNRDIILKRQRNYEHKLTIEKQKLRQKLTDEIFDKVKKEVLNV